MSAVAGGGVTYIKNLLTHLSKINSRHHFLVFTTLSGKKAFYFPHPDFTFVSYKIPSKNPIFRILWEQCLLPFLLKKEGVDVLFSPGNICPLFSKTPNVVMVQNLAPFDDSIISTEGKTQKYRLILLKLLTMASIKRAKKVIFISKKAIHDMKNLGLCLKHANLIYHGKNEELFHENVTRDKKLHVIKKYNLGKFILYVSNIHRYKNFFELIQAFAMIRNKIDEEIKLLLVGRRFDVGYYDGMMRFIREKRLEERILFLGEIPYDELPVLYGSCILFIYPSTCENCPNILIEAMACGAPMLASNIKPMPEICAGAAVYFDPTAPGEMADVLLKTIMDKSLISLLKTESLKRAKDFSWENAVMKTLKVFEGVL